MSDLDKLAYLASPQQTAAALGDWFSSAMSRVKNLVSPQPTAYSRITHTPIYVQDQGNYAGTYKDGRITISPGQWQVVPHESAHAIYDQAQLKLQAARLAPEVGEAIRNRILADPAYKSMPDAGSDEQLSDEGLGYSIGRNDQTQYVDKAAGAIADPDLAARLRRLNWNVLNSSPTPTPGTRAPDLSTSQ